jgi:uncharacterized membrane protein
MDKAQDISIKSGYILFAIAFIAFGIEQFIFCDFIAGPNLPLSLGIPGRIVAGILPGLVLIFAAVSIIISKNARLVTALAGLMILLWPGLRHILLLAAQPDSGTAWVWVGKSFAMCGCAFIIAASFPREGWGTGGFARFVQFPDRLVPAGRVFIGGFMIICGIEHFIYAIYVKDLVPGWIPGHMFWTYFAGVALIAAGIGLVFNVKTRLAATLSWIMIFLWAIFLHAPRAFVTLRNGNEITSFFETLALTGALLVLSRILKKN